MRKLPAFSLAGVGALALTGAAFAATSPKTHVMNVSLPDGSIAHVEYVGDVAPKVTIAPGPRSEIADAWGMPFPSFAGFDRIIEQMRQQSQEMMRRAQEMRPAHSGAAPYIASYGNLPAGQATSTTVVSVSNNGQTCTRTTEVVSQGIGKPPRVTSNVSGQCSDAASSSSRPTHPA